MSSKPALTENSRAYFCDSCQRRYVGVLLRICPQCGRSLRMVTLNRLPAQRVAAQPRRCCGR